MISISIEFYFELNWSGMECGIECGMKFGIECGMEWNVERNGPFYINIF